jgi:hypothetical protein
MARAMSAESATKGVLLVGVGDVPTVDVIIPGVLLFFRSVVNDPSTDLSRLVGVDIGGEGGSPGDVAMAGGIVVVAAFGENPFGAGIGFAEGKKIGGDILFGAWEFFLARGELVHEDEAEVALFAGEIDREETRAEA